MDTIAIARDLPLLANGSVKVKDRHFASFAMLIINADVCPVMDRFFDLATKSAYQSSSKLETTGPRRFSIGVQHMERKLK